jgi:hypothetical protein
MDSYMDSYMDSCVAPRHRHPSGSISESLGVDGMVLLPIDLLRPVIHHPPPLLQLCGYYQCACRSSNAGLWHW